MHFSTIVILPNRLDGSRDTLKSIISGILAPYDEHLEVAPYEEKCDECQYYDGECESCHGSGRRTSNYNPQSKWDWWTIGGRWTGSLSGYNPSEDPDNIQTCDICGGTGTRTMPIPSDPKWKPTPGKCNGCGGKGKHVKWPTEWKSHDGDTCPIGSVPADFFPFAFVTPDGEFHSKEWDDSNKDEVNEDFSRAREEFSNHMVVLVDCHI